MAISFFTSCNRDDCLDIKCLNGGDCAYGTCYCPDGYSGEHCEVYDSCYNLICLNGGTCDNGHCNCPEGYSGDDCATVLTPVALVITQVELLAFPPTNNGADWDVSDGPDILITINSGTEANKTQFVSTNFTNSFGPLTFTSQHGLPTALSQPSSTYTIGAWDVDDYDLTDLMGQRHFTPITEVSGSPDTLHLTGPGWDCYLYVEWKF